MTTFFKALNPVAEESGITYSVGGPYPALGQEMRDRTILEALRSLYAEPGCSTNSNRNTWRAIYGEHYDINLHGSQSRLGGQKGLVDFLIFPLLARKLIADCYLPHRYGRTWVLNVASFMIAIPLEVLRFSISVALAIVLIPINQLITAIVDPGFRIEAIRMPDLGVRFSEPVTMPDLDIRPLDLQRIPVGVSGLFAAPFSEAEMAERDRESRRQLREVIRRSGPLTQIEQEAIQIFSNDITDTQTDPRIELIEHAAEEERTVPTPRA